MTKLQLAKEALEEARTAYCHALAAGNLHACMTYKKLTAKRFAEVARIVKQGMAK